MARPAVWSRAAAADEVARRRPDQPQLLLVGPGGSGKTEIVDAVAHGLDRPPTWVRGRPLESEVTYGALDDLLADSPDDPRRARDGMVAALGGTPLLVVDDAQWLDEGSLDVVVALAERREELGLALLVAHRPDAGGRAGPSLARLATVMGADSTVSLAPLDDDEVAERVALAIDAPAGADLVEVVADASAGLVHLVDSLAAGWIDEGLISRGSLVVEDSASTLPESRAVAALVGPRLDALGSDGARVLRVLAFAPAADDEVIATIARVDRTGLGGVQASLRAAGLLTDRDDVPPALVAVLRVVTPDADRRALHEALGEILRERGSPATVVAEQLAEAGVGGRRAADVFLEAADALVDEAPELAGDWYRRAGDAGADDGSVGVGRAQVALASGDVSSARALVERGTGSRADRVLGAVELAQGRPERAVSHLARAGEDDWAALVGALRGPVPIPQATGHGPEAVVLAGLAAARDGEIDRALRAFVEAADAAEALGPGRVFPDSPHAVGAVVALLVGDSVFAGHLLDRAARTGVGGGFLLDRHRLLAGWVSLREGRFAAVESALAEADPSVPRDRLVASALASALSRRTGDLVGLEAAWVAAEPLLVGVEPDLLLLEPVGELAAASSRLDTWSRASRFLEPLRPLVSGWVPWELQLAWLDLQAALADDDPGPAVEAAAVVAACRAVNPQTEALGPAARAWSHVVAGDVDATEVERAAEALHRVGLTWEASQLTGQAAIRAEDGAVTRALLGRARELKTPTASTGAPEDDAGLSEREREVARLVVDGLTYKEVGAQLYISPKTVEHHVARIRQKVGASTRAEMLASLRSYLG